MKIQKFKVWWPAQGETEKTADTVDALTPGGAAEYHVDGLFLAGGVSNSDFPASIFVRLPGGELKVVKIVCQAEFFPEEDAAL